MKALVLRSPKVLELADVPEPRLTAAEHVLIEVEQCGICGSDLRYWAGDNPWAEHTLGRSVANPPNIILGHEFAGRVAKVNSAKYEHLLGTRVAVQAFRVCGECSFRRSGRENLRRQTIHIGHAQGWGQMDYYPGGYAEYCVGWGDLLFPLPDDLESSAAALTDIYCVAVHAAKRTNWAAGATVLCVGGGPVGASIAQVSRALGASAVLVSETSPIGLRVLHQMEPINAFDPRGEGLASAVSRVMGDARVDLVYDTVGRTDIVAEALELLAPSGALISLAVHDEPFATSLRSIGAERIVTSSSNAVYGDVAEAFERLLSSPKRAYKVLLSPSGVTGQPQQSPQSSLALPVGD